MSEVLINENRGIHTCENCGKDIPWFYIVHNRLSSGRIDVEVMPADRVGLRGKPYKIADGKYTVSCYCKNCGRLNSFDYDSAIELY